LISWNNASLKNTTIHHFFFLS